MTAHPFSGPTARWLIMASVSLLTVLLLLVWPTPEAHACKDCPFPMKVSDGRYLMPNGAIILEMVSTPLRGQLEKLRVTLRNADSGQVIAQGYSLVHQKRRFIAMKLFDQNGDTIQAEISRLNLTTGDIQVRLTCQSCEISSLLN